MSARRKCTICGSRRAPSQYTLKGRPGAAKEWRGACDQCQRRWYANHNMWNRYGITIEDYERMAEEQGHRCACCHAKLEERSGRGERFHIDHCHTSGAVRGLLCQPCNIAVGYIGDDPVRALRLAEYLIGTG